MITISLGDRPDYPFIVAGTSTCFALLSDELELITPFSMCKSYTQDQYYYYFTDYKNFSGNGYAVPLKSMNLLLTVYQPNNFIEKAQDLLWQIEKQLGIPESEIQEVDHKSEYAQKSNRNMFFFKANKAWYTCIPLISLYTLLMRIANHHYVGASFWESIAQLINDPRVGSSDRSYLKSSMVGIEHIVQQGYKNLFHENAKQNYTNLKIGSHEDGIVYYSSKLSKEKASA